MSNCWLSDLPVGFFPTYMRPPYSSCTAECGCEDDMAELGYHITYFVPFHPPLPNGIILTKKTRRTLTPRITLTTAQPWFRIPLISSTKLWLENRQLWMIFWLLVMTYIIRLRMCWWSICWKLWNPRAIDLLRLEIVWETRGRTGIGQIRALRWDDTKRDDYASWNLTFQDLWNGGVTCCYTLYLCLPYVCTTLAISGNKRVSNPNSFLIWNRTSPNPW